ncbi:MAG TPA: dodecin family protein [Solirubrobacteraceae bacterium]|jgi:dodecin|nr:dodecin family protein [Solirubrobacteraceae bacterium]
MDETVYRVTELIGVSSESWEAAARNAIETAARTLRDLRVAEAQRFDVTIEDGKVKSYRVRLDVSFKYAPDGAGPEADQAEEWEHTRHELP